MDQQGKPEKACGPVDTQRPFFWFSGVSTVNTLSRPEINNFRSLLNETLRHVTAPLNGGAVTCYAMLIRLGAKP